MHLLLAAGGYYRESQPVKCREEVAVGVLRPRWDIYNMSPTPQAWGTLRKRGWPTVRVRGL